MSNFLELDINKMDPAKLFKVHVFYSIDRSEVYVTSEFSHTLDYIKTVPGYLLHKQNLNDLYSFFVYTKRFYRQLSQAIR